MMLQTVQNSPVKYNLKRIRPTITTQSNSTKKHKPNKVSVQSYDTFDTHTHSDQADDQCQQGQPCQFVEPSWLQPGTAEIAYQSDCLIHNTGSLGEIKPLMNMIRDYLPETICLHPGLLLDCRDNKDEWYVVRITHVNYNNNSDTSEECTDWKKKLNKVQVKIHFLGWSEHYDETLSFESTRFAALHTHTQQSYDMQYLFKPLLFNQGPMCVEYKCRPSENPTAHTQAWISAHVVEIGHAIVKKDLTDLGTFQPFVKIECTDKKSNSGWLSKLLIKEQMDWQLAPVETNLTHCGFYPLSGICS